MPRLLSSAALAAILVLAAGQASAQDAEAGKKVFARCGVCHGVGDVKKPLGPTLNGVIGRTAGTDPDYAAKYSKATKEAGAGGLVWDEANISEYIADPKKKIPGNKMAFAGLKAETDRLNVIAYIKTFSD